MQTEKIARKPMSIGPFRVERGEVISDEVDALLPAGRMQTLIDQGLITERPVESDSDLAAKVAALEERIAILEARRGPGRPRKDEG